jgi:hypothetical protein
MELRASHLLSKQSITWTTSQILLLFSWFCRLGLSLTLPRLVWTILLLPLPPGFLEPQMCITIPSCFAGDGVFLSYVLAGLILDPIVCAFRAAGTTSVYRQEQESWRIRGKWSLILSSLFLLPHLKFAIMYYIYQVLIRPNIFLNI